jgi:tetratricopeptide (TPR) repeat protein
VSFEAVKAAMLEEDWEGALKQAGKHLNEFPDDPAMLYMAGRVMLEAHRPGLAKPIYERCVRVNPKAGESWLGYGKALTDLWQLEHAEDAFRMALQLARGKEMKSPLANMGLVKLLRGRPEEAMELCHKALYYQRDDIDVAYNLGTAHLMKREWEIGWKLYETALGVHESRRERIYNDPDEGRWNGDKDKTVVAYGEQGIGDEISFASCLPDLIKDSKKVVIDCDHRLEGLFKRSFPEADVYGTRFRVAEWAQNYKFDGRVAFGSLPKFYRKKEEDFPGTPYLVADPERRTQWKALLEKLPGKKIGLAWNGGLPMNGKVHRSVTLEDLLPILKTDHSFISLEYRDPTKELEKFHVEHGIKIHEWGRATRTLDYDDTAALIAELDLVICVTTATLHTAGALGVPCWVMVPKNPSWQFPEGEMPWYRSVRMFRKQASWSGVVHQMREELLKPS